MKAPSVGVEPVLGPLNEPPMQGLGFTSGREQYGFQPHSHGDMLNIGLQQQQQLHMPLPFSNQQLNPDQPSHPYQDGVTSCLHGDRHIGFSGSNTGHQHMFETEFNHFTEAQTDRKSVV